MKEISEKDSLIHNKYYRWYISLVSKDDLGTTERHHILPKSMGGSNKKSNIVRLSLRKHYLAHVLLSKFTTGIDYYKMCAALKTMSDTGKYNSKQYEWIKKGNSEYRSIAMKRNWSDPNFRNKVLSSREQPEIKEKRINNLKAYLLENSPLKDENIHKKSMLTREKNKSNIWLTNNPMKDPDKAKTIASKRSGTDHYSFDKQNYYYKISDGEWVHLENPVRDSVIAMGWSMASFYKVLKSGVPMSRGNMKGVQLKRVKK